MHDGFEWFEAWVAANDLTIDLVTVWCLAIGFWALMCGKLVAVLTLWGSHDRTAVGRSLKWQKSSEAVICGAMALLYTLTLWGYYHEYQFSLFERFAVRVFIIAGLAGAVWFGARFVWALTREAWSRAP